MAAQYGPEGPDNFLLRLIAGHFANRDGTPRTSAQENTGNSRLPYGAASYVVSYVGSTNNINVITYHNADGDPIATRTFTYAAAGAADNDLITSSTDAVV